MEINERMVNNTVILDVVGKMTLGEGDELLTETIQDLLQSGKKRILLNLKAVPCVDSAGLAAISKAYITVSKNGGQIKILHVSASIYDLMVITNLNLIFICYDDEDQALRTF